MNQTEIEIFTLCERLAVLLRDKEAIADLKRLYEKHPEMFNNMQEVKETIDKVVTEPELITSAKREKAILIAKQLDCKKMGEVAIENDNGTNVIYHTNKKNIREFEKLQKQVESGKQSLVEASSTKVAPTRLSRYASESDNSPMCQETLSTTANDIILQSNEILEQNNVKNKPKVRKRRQ